MSDLTKTQNRGRSNARTVLKRIFEIREIVIFLLVMLLAVFMALNHQQFLTTANVRIIGNYMATDMIIGAFLTISLIAGNTDFSVGSNMGCSAFVCGLYCRGIACRLCNRCVKCVYYCKFKGSAHDCNNGNLDDL